MRYLFTLAILILVLSPIHAGVVNVRDLGAAGDGKADDTAAFEKALEKAVNDRDIQQVLVPAGDYRITRTLSMRFPKAVTIRGEGWSGLGYKPGATNIYWAGEEGGTLIETVAAGGVTLEGMNLVGIDPAAEGDAADKPRAGVLYQSVSVRGGGNMINRITSVGFFKAGTGIAMARERNEICNADYLLEAIMFRDLDNGFKVANDQGVDYLFNFIFALNVGTVLNFERGGNLMVNNAQMTNCGVFLNIEGGGRNTGAYVCNNIRVERGDGGRVGRAQLLRSYPRWRQANVIFTGFDDCQWNWKSNRTEARSTPLCDIGPGTLVTFQSSIFNSPAARLTGEDDAPASAIFRGCSFSYVTPGQAVSANGHGHFKIVNPTDSHMKPLPDVIKWPEEKTIVVPPGQEHTPELPPAPEE